MKRTSTAFLAVLLVAAGGCGASLSNPTDDGGGGGGGREGGGTQLPEGGTSTWVPDADILPSCAPGTTTSISGTVYAPNGTDPVPQALVYLPDSISEFPPTIACEDCSSPTDPTRFKTVTAYDGTFTLKDIPAGNHYLVVQKGRFRKRTLINLTACVANTPPAGALTLPSKEDAAMGWDIPKIAVVNGDYDMLECVLKHIGLDPSAIDMYQGASSCPFFGGGSTYPDPATLFTNYDKLKTYNIVFLNCTGEEFDSYLDDPTNGPIVKANLGEYVQNGGRLYVTDWAYDYLDQTSSLASHLSYECSSGTPQPEHAAAIGADGITSNATITDSTMLQWLKLFPGAVNADGTVTIKDFLIDWVMMGKTMPMGTTVWVHGPVSTDSAAACMVSEDRPLTVTFDVNKCGRVLYSSYHTLGRDPSSTTYNFPAECTSSTLAPQERILEYLIFEVSACIGTIG